MLRIDSNYASEAELRGALESAGMTPETTTPETPAQPETPAATGVEAAGDVPVVEKTQESQAGEKPGEQVAAPVVPAQEAKPPFKSKRVRLFEDRQRLQDQLDQERGSKTQLQSRLDEATAKLAALEPKTVEAAKGPVKPTRPTKASCEFDDDKYEVALGKYDQDMTTYHADVTQRAINETITKHDQQKREDDARAENEKSLTQFFDKVKEGSQAIEDWDEVLDELGTDKLEVSDSIEWSIRESDNPALLIHFLTKDQLEGGKELKRISALSPVRQVRAIQALEDKIIADRTPKPPEPAPAAKAAAPVAAPPVAAAPPPEKSPVKPKPKSPAGDPIEPLGPRGGVPTPRLEDAQSNKDYFRMRLAGVNR